DTRFFVDGASDAVSAQIANYREAAAAPFAFDYASNLGDAETGAGHQHGFMESPFGAGHQAPALFGDFAGCDGFGGGPHEAVLFNGDVKLDQVAGPDRPLAGDAVHGLVVQADTAHSGELVHQL